MTILDTVVRVSNGLVFILGLTLLSYGGYLVSVCKLNTIAEAALTLGVLDLCLGMVAIACYRSLFVLRLYGLVMSFLVVSEFVLAILFLTNSPSVTSLSTCAGDRALDFAKTQNAVSWIILAVALFQSMSLVLVFFQVCSVDKPFDESQYQEEKFLGSGDKYGALSGEEAVPSAQARYQQKHASFYAKYGLR